MVPLGRQTLTVDFGSATLRTYTYRPAGTLKGIMLNFHGASRNAEGARDAAEDMADEYGLYIVAPLFEEDSYPNSAFQMGGVRAGTSPDSWTVALVDDMAAWAHAQIDNTPGAETIAFGHSGGGQFWSRAAAFGPVDVFDKIIVANPSTHVRASVTEDIPYGFDGLGTATQEQDALKKYLARPVTLYAGAEDNDPNAADLSTSAAAMRQGDNRLDRAKFVFNEAKTVAQNNGWKFNWELVIAAGVGHSARQLFNVPEWSKAFDGRVSKVYSYSTVQEFNDVIIADFKPGDIIDLSAIDAQSDVSGNQTFQFLGFVTSSAFTTAGAQLRLRHADGDTHIYLNSDSDTYFEAHAIIKGTFDLTADNFVL